MRSRGFARVLMTGGGTAGHVNPALAIGRHLGSDGAAFLFVGVRGRAEEQVVPREGIPIRFVRASGFPGRRPSVALVRFAADLLAGTLKAAWILLRFRPDVIIGTGGFASAPVVFAAALLRRVRLTRAGVFIHEQNAAPGLANQVAGRLADRVFVTFRQTLSSFPGNGVLAGYPLRGRIGPIDRAAAAARLDFTVPPGRTVVFAFGGSQGARTLNRAVVDALGDLVPHRDRLFVIHGTGLFRSREYDASADTSARFDARYSADQRRLIGTFYVSRPYFHDIECVYALADLVAVRAGAGTLNEVASLGLPAIVVPKSNLPGEHQVMNARAMARHGGAEVIYEETVLEDGRLIEKVDGARLAERMLALASDRGRLAAMGAANRGFLRCNALDEVARHIRAFADGTPIDAGLGRRADTGPAGAAAADPCSASAGQPLPGNQELLGRLERAAAQGGAAFTPEAAVPCADDLAYLWSRAASLLTAPAWEQRNVGVKLVGLLKAQDKLPLLLALLADRRPASGLRRLLGGDFVQVGFIRRNIITAIVRLDVVSAEVEAALLDAFADPYYEVRAEAARAAAHFGARLPSRARFVAAVIALLHDRTIEVASAAAESLGRLGDAADALPALLAMSEARFWKVRAAALKGILSLVTRGEVRDYSALRAGLAAFVLSSTDFTPQFEIKAAYRHLMEAAQAREARGQ